MSAKVRVTPGVVWQELEGELVLLQPDTGRYHGLNPVGGLIWRKLAAGAGEPEIVASLIQAYEVDAVTAEAELVRLVAELRAARLLE